MFPASHVWLPKGKSAYIVCIFLQTGHWSIPFAESGLTSTVVTLYGLMHCILNLVERGNLRESLPALRVVCKKTMAFLWFSTENALNSAFAPKPPRPMHEIQLAETSRCRRGWESSCWVCISLRSDIFFLMGYQLLWETCTVGNSFFVETPLSKSTAGNSKPSSGAVMFQLEWIDRNCCQSWLVVGLRCVFLVDALPEKVAGIFWCSL